jgi:nitroreductase
LPNEIGLDQMEDFLAHQRAIRRFEDRDIDDALIERILRAGTRAPSARNVQPWRFIVIRDRDTKAKLGKVFDDLGQQLYGAGAPDHTTWAEVPVLVVIASEYAFGTTESGVAALGASIYPCVQNILLAAQAAGIGTVLTTRWKQKETEVRPLLGLPDTMAVHAIIPMGWPSTKVGKNRRTPVAELTSRETFGQPWR